MSIIQESQSIDARKAALDGWAAGQDLTFGVIRVENELGPWTVRVRLEYGPKTGPDVFASTLVPQIGVTVREGGARGFHEWSVGSEVVTRDASFVAYGTGIDVSVTVARAAAARDCTVVAWLERGACPETMLADTAYIAGSLDDWKARIIGSGVDQSIPADAHAVDLSALYELIPGFPIVYPTDVTWVDPAGLPIRVTRLTAASQLLTTVPIPTNARWLALVNPALEGLAISYPVVWRRH